MNTNPSEYELKAILSDLAEHAIGDEMDRWPDIQAQIARRAPTRRRAILRYAPVVVALIAILLVSAGAYALYQAVIQQDPGLQGVEEEGLLTEINQSQTVDGVTVTLTTGYADPTRIAFNFTVEGWEPEIMNTILRLSDQEGYRFSYRSALSDEQQARDPVRLSAAFYTQATREEANGEWSIHNDYMDTAGDHLDLTLDLWLADSYLIPPVDPPGDVAEAGPPPLGPFTFRFALPVTPEITLTPNETVTVNNLDVTLTQVVVAASQTVVTLCYDLPDTQDWQPIATLMIDDQVGQYTGMGMMTRPTAGDVERCQTLTFAIFYDGEPHTLLISVGTLRTSAPSESPDYWEAVIAELNRQGIEVEMTFDHGAHFDFIATPEAMSETEVNQRLTQAMTDVLPSVDGPWTFEISVPQMGS